MKMNYLSIACGAAIAALAGQATAHGPFVVPDIVVFVCGPSSGQLATRSVMKGMCIPGTYDEYHDAATVNGADYRAYFCTISGTSTLLDGKKILLHARALDGASCISAVALATPISRMQVGGSCVPTGGSDPSYKCSSAVLDIPQAGESAVEPNLFIGINNGGGGGM